MSCWLHTHGSWAHWRQHRSGTCAACCQYFSSVFCKEYLLHFVQCIISEEEQSHDLHGRESAELVPVDLNTHDMGTLLVLLGIEQDVLYGLVYHVLRMPI